MLPLIAVNYTPAEIAGAESRSGKCLEPKRYANIQTNIRASPIPLPQDFMDKKGTLGVWLCGLNKLRYFSPSSWSSANTSNHHSYVSRFSASEKTFNQSMTQDPYGVHVEGVTNHATTYPKLFSVRHFRGQTI
jgi:hypothetical protein